MNDRLSDRRPANKAARMTAALVLATLFSGPLMALGDSPVAPDDEQDAGAEPTAILETHSIRRKNVFPSLRKKEGSIGDYAVVTHDCCRKEGKARTHKRKFRFSLDAVTSDGVTANLKGNAYTSYHEDPDSRRGFLGGLWAYILEDSVGITDPYGDANYYFDAYTSNFTAAIVTEYSPDDTWQLQVDMQWSFGEVPASASGTISNGTRTLSVWGLPEEMFAHTRVEIYEGDTLLASSGGEHLYDDPKYVFSADLSPETKLVVLASMEMFAINQGGGYREQ